jgi:hypothetical protein
LVGSNVVKELGKVICGRVLSANMLKLYVAIVDLVLDVVVVDVNMLCTLMVTLSVYEVKGWLVVTVMRSSRSRVGGLVLLPRFIGHFLPELHHRDVT